MEWQTTGKNHWVYGEKVRGVIRDRKAEVWWDKDKSVWRWSKKGRMSSGTGGDFVEAIEAAEAALVEDW
jgi:hypothetical protein